MAPRSIGFESLRSLTLLRARETGAAVLQKRTCSPAVLFFVCLLSRFESTSIVPGFFDFFFVGFLL